VKCTWRLKVGNLEYTRLLGDSPTYVNMVASFSLKEEENCKKLSLFLIISCICRSLCGCDWDGYAYQ
jgi:hypothetical protein